MKTPIHSKWHKISSLEGMDIAIQVPLDANRGSHDLARFVKHDVLSDLFRFVDKLPKYVMYDDIVDLVYTDSENSFHESVRAMLKAKLCHLPFPEMLVEFDTPKHISGDMIDRPHFEGVHRVRTFVWLGENQKGFVEKHKQLTFSTVTWNLVERPNERPMIVLNTNMSFGSFIEDLESTGGKLGLQYQHHPAMFMSADTLPKDELKTLTRGNMDESMWVASLAITAVVGLLRTRGVVQERIEAPAKLNKKRAESGKAPIRDHTVIRIGHTYNREGEKVDYKSTGRHMPVHWRAGHIRNQRFGPGLSKSYEVFIEPMLVNYSDGDAPVPVKEVTI